MPAEIPTLAEIEALIRRVFREELRKNAPDVLSTQQAAEYVGVVLGRPRTTKTIRAWVEEGLIPATKRGRSVMIRREDLDDFLAHGGRRAKRSTDPADAIVATLGATE